MLKAFVFRTSLLLLLSSSAALPLRDSVYSRGLDESNEGDDDNTNVITQGIDQVNYAKSRVEDDLSDMWTTSPNEWGDEYWEVLAGALIIAFGVLLCFCCVCCLPFCRVKEEEGFEGGTQSHLSESDKKKFAQGKQAVDKVWAHIDIFVDHESGKYQQKCKYCGHERFSFDIETEYWADHFTDHNKCAYTPNDVRKKIQAIGFTTAGAEEATAPTTSGVCCIPTVLSGEEIGSVSTDGASAAEKDNARGRRIVKRQRRKRTSLWNEIVSVWTEFFSDVVFKKQKEQNIDGFYSMDSPGSEREYKYKSPPVRQSKTRASKTRSKYQKNSSLLENDPVAESHSSSRDVIV